MTTILALMAGAHLAARYLAMEGAERFPDHAELQKMAHMVTLLTFADGEPFASKIVAVVNTQKGKAQPDDNDRNRPAESRPGVCA